MDVYCVVAVTSWLRCNEVLHSSKHCDESGITVTRTERRGAGSRPGRGAGRRGERRDISNSVLLLHKAHRSLPH
ncbi:unnamed protein product, partial [Brenthis ino]